MKGQRFWVGAAVAAMVLIWGTSWAAIRVNLESIPPFAGVALRFATAALALVAMARIWKVPNQAGPRLYKIWWAETVFSLCLPYGVVYWAEQWVPSGLSSILFSTMPLFVVVLAHWWLAAEPMRTAELLGILIAVGGIAFIFSDDLTLTGGILVPAMVMILAPLGAAIAHVLIKRWGSGMHPLNVVTVPMAVTAGVMGALSLAVESERTIDFGMSGVVSLLYLGVVASALAFSLYYWVLERVAATRLSLITLAIPIVAVVVGITILDEPFSVKTALGCLLVLGGVGVASRSSSETPRCVETP